MLQFRLNVARTGQILCLIPYQTKQCDWWPA